MPNFKYQCKVCMEKYNDLHTCKVIEPENIPPIDVYKCLSCSRNFSEPENHFIGYTGFLGRIRSIWDKSKILYLPRCPYCKKYTFGKIHFINRPILTNQGANRK